MPLKYCCIFLLLLCGRLHAQEIVTSTSPAFISRVPFKMYSGGVIIVKAAFENIKDSLSFILDTGSGGISLDSTTCSNYNISSRTTDTIITGIGGSKKVNFVYNKTLHFPGLDVDKLNFHINNYEILTSVYGEKIDGIIGYSFLRRYIVKVNFDSLYMDIHKPGIIEYPRGGTLLRPRIVSIPVQRLTIRNKKKVTQQFYFDTGAGLSFLLSEQFVKDSNFLLTKRKTVVTHTEGIGGVVPMRLTVIKELKLGPYKFFNVPTYLYNDEYGVLRYPQAAGLFGNELLRRFNMIINYGQREIHLLPNGRFNEPFDYAYTGLGIYNTDGVIIVEDVIADSPAQKAGILKGDIVICVDNNCSNNIQTYKNKLLQANQRLKMIVSRNGTLIELYIRPSSIL